jgi:hypothetical protein
MRLGSLVIAVVLASTAAVAAEDSSSLTGTYQGFFVCDDVTDGAGGGFGRAMTMEVVQSGERVDMRNTVAVDPSGPPSQTVFRGHVAAAPGDGSVSGYVEACDSTFPHKELIRIFPASPARQPFGFAADTVFVSDAVPGVHGLVAESCKWSLERVSTETPTFKPCK